MAAIPGRDLVQLHIVTVRVGLFDLLSFLCTIETLKVTLLPLDGIQIPQNWYDLYLTVLCNFRPRCRRTENFISFTNLNLVIEICLNDMTDRLYLVLSLWLKPCTLLLVTVNEFLSGVGPDSVFVL